MPPKENKEELLIMKKIVVQATERYKKRFVGSVSGVKLTTKQQKVMKALNEDFGCSNKKVVALISALDGFDYSKHLKTIRGFASGPSFANGCAFVPIKYGSSEHDYPMNEASVIIEKHTRKGVRPNGLPGNVMDSREGYVRPATKKEINKLFAHENKLRTELLTYFGIEIEVIQSMLKQS